MNPCLLLVVLAALLLAVPAEAEQVTVSPINIPQYICMEQFLQVYISSNVSETLVITPTNNTVLVDSINIIPFENQIYNFSLSCNGYDGAFSLTGSLLSTGEVVFVERSYCKGEMSLIDPIPSTIIRGNDFSLYIGVSPATTSVTDFLVFVDNTLIIPGAHHFTLAVGQSQGTINFISPKGQVGPVNITIQSRKVFDYGPIGPNCRLGTITLPITVMGTMSTNVPSLSPSQGVPITAILTISPPAGSGGVYVNTTYGGVGLGSPAVIYFAEGQSQANFSFIPSVFGAANIFFETDYYEDLTQSLNVVGSIFASFPRTIFSTTYVTSISILPSFSTPVTVFYSCSSTGSVSCTAGSVNFAVGASTSFLDLQFSGTGKVTITFSATGFNNLDVSVTIAANNCPPGQIPNDFNPSGACLVCPASSTGAVCGGNGACLESQTVAATAVCSCDPSYYGPFCQSDAVTAVYQPQGGSISSYYPFSQISLINYSYPGNAFQNAVAPETLFISSQTDASSTNLNTATTLPITKNGYSAVSTGISFDVLAAASDNTALQYSSSSGTTLSIGFSYDTLSQDFLRMQIYWANPATGAWVPAGQTCATLYPTTHNLDTYIVSTTVCETGQFAVFEVLALPVVVDSFVPELLPLNSTQFDNQEATTGVGGVAPDPPAVQPTFPPLIVLSPPKSQEYINSSSTLGVSILMSIAALIAVLWM